MSVLSETTFTRSAKVITCQDDIECDDILYTTHDVDPKEVMEQVEREKIMAAIVPPKNRQDFIEASKTINEKDIELMKEWLMCFSIEDGMIYTEPDLTISSEPLGCVMRTFMPEFIMQIMRRNIPYVEAASTLSTMNFNPFHAPIGELSDFPKMHADRAITSHVSAIGAPLEFLDGEFSKSEIISFNDDKQSDPEILKHLKSVQQGDMVIFNGRFWHRSPHLAREIGQLAIAAYE